MSERFRYGDYKGNPMLILAPDSDYPFQFGLGKAKLILANLDAIQKFVKYNGKPPEEQPELPGNEPF